jgi:hypothetical protein
MPDQPSTGGDAAGQAETRVCRSLCRSGTTGRWCRHSHSTAARRWFWLWKPSRHDRPRTPTVNAATTANAGATNASLIEDEGDAAAIARRSIVSVATPRTRARLSPPHIRSDQSHFAAVPIYEAVIQEQANGARCSGHALSMFGRMPGQPPGERWWTYTTPFGWRRSSSISRSRRRAAARNASPRRTTTGKAHVVLVDRSGVGAPLVSSAVVATCSPAVQLRRPA